MSGLAGARGLVTACRIHHEDKVWDEPRGLLVRESSVTFGESCARMATATPQSLPRTLNATVLFGFRILKWQHDSDKHPLKLEVAYATGTLTEVPEDRMVSGKLDAVFGTFEADEVWVGYSHAMGITTYPFTVKTRLTIPFQRAKGNKKKGFQLVPWAFTLASDFGPHHLLGISVLNPNDDDESDPRLSVCTELSTR
jgi:hypothetical protein